MKGCVLLLLGSNHDEELSGVRDWLVVLFWSRVPTRPNGEMRIHRSIEAGVGRV